MKFTPMAVWRICTSSAAGAPTSTSSSRMTSGPPVSLNANGARHGRAPRQWITESTRARHARRDRALRSPCPPTHAAAPRAPTILRITQVNPRAPQRGGDHAQMPARPPAPDVLLHREARAAQRDGAEHAGEQRAEHAADAVHRRDVERVVDLELALEELRSEEAHRTRERVRWRPRPCGPTKPDAGVMVPRPATMPVTTPNIDGLP